MVSAGGACQLAEGSPSTGSGQAGSKQAPLTPARLASESVAGRPALSRQWVERGISEPADPANQKYRNWEPARRVGVRRTISNRKIKNRRSM
ncbi:MAG: hypothetical protein LJE87_02755 [Deltaproteobacteria bacterium]|nr:hypothetical protein [Deltaproteobacteria bacterium]